MRSIRTCGALATMAATVPGRVMLLPLNLPSPQIDWLDGPSRLAISEAAVSFLSRS